MDRLSVIIFRNNEGKILLQYRDSGAPAAALMWSFFGGNAEGDETAEEAILREVQEELRIHIDSSELHLLANEVHTEECERNVFFFECTRPVSWNAIDVHEGAGAAFLSKEEIATMGSITETARYFVSTYA